MEEQYPLPIDAQLRDDLDGGRMDASIREALAEHRAGNSRAL